MTVVKAVELQWNYFIQATAYGAWLPREPRTDQNVSRLSLFVKEYFPFAKKYSETLRIHIINETEATRELFAFCLTSVKEDNEKYNKKVFYVFIRPTEEGLLAVERTPN